MAGIKKSQIWQTKRNIKEFYIMVIIFILLSSVFPSVLNTEMPICGTYLTEGTVTETPNSIVIGNAVSHDMAIELRQPANEEMKGNSYFETTTSVPWWNTNWHYRRIYNITGTGNISLLVNFTTLLSSLQVANKTFDNASIAIVRYEMNGTMTLVNKTWFNESSTFHNKTNALGTLLWNVSESCLYGIYFDVIENRGVRSPMTETLSLTQTGGVQASVESTRGWWPEFMTTFETYYPLNTTLYVQVYTTALAKHMTAQFFCNGQPEFNLSFNTLDYLYWTDTTPNLSKTGDWTIRVIGYDDAGYQTTALTTGFYVGQPDLVVSALTMPSICYIGYNVTVIANICALNTTVKYVDVSLLIDNVINATQQNLTIQKDENRTLQFSWRPTSKGQHNVSVFINYTDSNPGNNKRWKLVTVEGIPDMAVLNISVAPTPVHEGNPVAVTASISNTGDGNATDYEIILYCEQNENNHTMQYIDIRNSTKVSLKKNEYKNITIIWQNTQYGKISFKGEWAVGIQIRNTTQTPDKNDTNNKKALFHVLRVIPSERNPPILSNLEYPGTQEQGKQVLIRVKATDESGIDTVTISIKTPDKTYVNATMTATQDDRYEYLFDALQLGRHDLSIRATDRSPFKNQSTISGIFVITQDKTLPTITYFGVNPFVQLPNAPVEIRCIATDFSGISSVKVTIQFPDALEEVHPMSTVPPDTKYVYTRTYQPIGKYLVTITVQDNEGNKKTTEEKTFWITNDLNDTDSDGMPDAWERLYGFDPYDPTDALLDADNDGVTNLQEYQQGTHPLKKASSEISERIQQNAAYLVTSVVVFAAIVGLAWYGMRRHKP